MNLSQSISKLISLKLRTEWELPEAGQKGTV